MKKITQETKTDILLSLFIASLVAANLLGTKITTILGVSVSVGIFAYPLSFLITDMIEEVFGKEKTKKFILAGFIALILVLILTLISVALPPAQRYPHNSAYLIIFKSSLRMIAASLIAFVLAQTHDICAIISLQLSASSWTQLFLCLSPFIKLLLSSRQALFSP